jgi:hypothetical protein
VFARLVHVMMFGFMDHASFSPWWSRRNQITRQILQIS